MIRHCHLILEQDLQALGYIQRQRLHVFWCLETLCLGPVARGTQLSGICAFPSFPPTDTLARLLFLLCSYRQNPLGNKHKLFYCNGISLKEMLHSTAQ